MARGASNILFTRRALMKRAFKLAAVIAAMAMALSFVSCDDDDDDDDDSGGSATATYYGEEEDTVFSSVKVTYNSSGVVTKITVTPAGGSAQTITSISSDTDETLGTYYYGLVTVDSTGYEVDVCLYGGTWYYYWDELGTAITATASDTALGEVVVYYDSDYSYITAVTVDGEAAEESEDDESVWTVTIGDTTYTITITMGTDGTSATYSYEEATSDDTGDGDGDDTGDGGDTDDDDDDADDGDDTGDDEDTESTSIDLTSFTLSSSTPALLIDTTTLAAIIDASATVYFEVTVTSSGSEWLTLYSDTSWSNSTAVVGWSDGSGTYSVSASSLSTYSSTGVYVAGSGLTLDAVYYKSSGDDEDTDDNDDDTDDNGDDDGSTSIDITSFTLSSSTPALLIDTTTLAAIIDASATVYFEVTVTSSGSEWLTLYSDTSWNNSTAVVGWSDGSGTYSVSASSLSTYSSTGVYVAGSGLTLDAVYYK